MAARKTETGVSLAPVVVLTVVVVVMMLASCATSQNNGCSSVMMTLSPCLDYISGKVLVPEFTCCTTLAGIVQSDPRCLCMVLDGSAASFGIAINHTRALELPGVLISKLTRMHGSLISGVPTPPPAPDTPTLTDEPVETSDDADPPDWIVQFDAARPGSNKTASSTNSKKAASLMATMLIPTCSLLYIF